jgi:hypothetical protein
MLLPSLPHSLEIKQSNVRILKERKSTKKLGLSTPTLSRLGGHEGHMQIIRQISILVTSALEGGTAFQAF